MSISYLMKGLVGRGHQVWIGLKPDTEFYRIVEHTGAILVPMPFRSKTDRETLRLIRDLVGQEGIELINAQSSKDRYLAIFARWRYRLRVKVVFTRRQMSKSSGLISRLLYNAGTDGIIAVSEQVRDSLLRDGIREEKIRIIRNGTPREKYKNLSSSRSENLRGSLQLPPGNPVIGCVSRKKQQRQLLQALTFIDRPVTVLFIGIDSLAGEESLLHQAGKIHRILFLGLVEPAEVLDYYALFDLFVLPSTMEGLSQSLLEAMFLKVPVIATAAAGNLDLIEPEKTGLLFENEQPQQLAGAIMRLLDNPEEGLQLASNAFQMVQQRYLIDRVLDEYEKYFGQLING